jgi:hypothetical protein
MGLKTDVVTFTDCAGGIRAPETLDVELKNTHFVRGGQAIHFYQPSVLEEIGLPSGTPRELLEELVAELRKHHEASQDQKLDIVKKSRLGGWLSGAASFTTVAKNIIDIVSKFM